MLTLQGLDRQRATYPVVLGRGARRRFETEIRALVDLPPTAGLLPVVGGGFDVDGHPYVERALEGAPGLESLGQRVRHEGRPLDVATAVPAVVAALRGLAALHAAGMVHGGVRPDVLVAAPPVLADPVPPVVAARVGPLGPAFAAPEVLQGEVPTPAADVYAAAATLVYLVTGRGPWTEGGADAEQVLLQIVSATPPDLGVVAAHPGLATAVVRALAAEPAARPDANDLGRELSRGLDPGAGPDDAGFVDGADRLDTVSPFVPQVPVADLSPRPVTADPTIPPTPRAAVLGAAAGTPGFGRTGGATSGDQAARPLGSRYLLHEALGRGATGTVFRATCHASPGEPLTEVAVKVLREDLADDPRLVARFLAERTTLLGLDHPNLVRIRDLVVEGSTMAIVMDLVDGPDLRRWMRTAPPLPPAAACRLLAQLAGALAVVHAAGVVHRDLKPENVLLERVGTAELLARLTDFGVARSVREAAARLTQHGVVVGTPAYMAPEVTTGSPAGPPADVYALGILAYELLVGCRPFADDQAVALAHAHATLAPGRPPGLDERLWQVVAWCLAKDPAIRPPAERLAAALVGVATAVGDGAPPVPRLDAPPPALPVTNLAASGTRDMPLSMAPGAGGQRPPMPPGVAAALEPATGSAPVAPYHELPPTPTETTPPGSTPQHPTRSVGATPPRSYSPDDHLTTDLGTAPPPPRPHQEPEQRKGRRRLYLMAGAGVATALVAGLAIGLLTMDAEPEGSEPPSVPEPTYVYLPTTGERLGPDTVNLTFTPLPEADTYRVIRDPQAENGHVDMRARVPEGMAAVPIADPLNDQAHCYVIQAVVLQAPSSSTSSTQQRLVDDYCPDGEPPP